VLGLFSLLFVNLNVFFSSWDNHVQLIVYLEDNISNTDKKKLKLLFDANDEIESVDFVSRDQAWARFQNEFEMKSNFITSLKYNPLPASYVIKFKNHKNRLENIKKFSLKIKDLEGIESFEYGEKWISRFEQFMIFLRGFILAFGVLLFSGMTLIISNTIKLSIHTRKDEIDLMSLLGATHAFIKAPLILEGVMQGILGAFFSLVGIKLFYTYITFKFQGSLDSIFRGVDFQFLTDPLIFSILSTGIIIGILGSFLSVNQFLDSRNLE
jgi:cell division transport system permease protein